jgi:hypothetical protein
MQVDTLAKHVFFSTVRVTKTDSKGNDSVGTGFLFNAEKSQDAEVESIPLLVSNKHVLMGAATLKLDLLVRNADNSGPQLGEVHSHLCVGPSATDAFGHPDAEVDVAVKPLANSVITMMRTRQLPYLVMLNWSHLPSCRKARRP